MNRWAFQFFSPIILFCLMLIDGQFSSFFAGAFSQVIFPVSHIFLIFLMYSTLKHRLIYLLIMSTLLGVIYDSYFLGVIGIAAALFPLISLFLYEIQETVFQNRWTIIFTTVIIVFGFETLSFGIEYAFGLATISPLNFIIKELAATLILNVILAVILPRPLGAMYGLNQDRSIRKSIKL